VTGLLPGFLERYADALAPEHRDLCQLFVAHIGDWLALRAGPNTVSHGDFRLDNLLFQPAGARPVVVDWQTAAWGAPASDVAYFVGGCLSVEDRRVHEQDLLVRYHEALRHRGVDSYSLGDLKGDVRRNTFAGVLMAIVASMVVQRTERGDLMFLTSTTRHAQHALDAGAPALLLATS
jgi:aminoglycoside phosphotransferase (APT) family kinase protein